MITLLYLDVIEICLLNIPEGTTTAKIKPATVVEQLKLLTRGTRKSTVPHISKILRITFPLHKNNRRHTNSFKISQSAADLFVMENGLLLRSVEHAKWSMSCRRSHEDIKT